MIHQDVVTSNVQGNHAKKAVPILLLLFLFCLVIDNSFKIVSVDMAKHFNISATTVSWQTTLAGLIFGIGAVVYSTLTDIIGIRRLFTISLVFITISSLLGYLFRESFEVVVLARMLQTAGLAAAETLYIIFVSKHLPPSEHKKYYGYSTSCFAIGLILGGMTGGFVSTYLNWATLFLVPLATILFIPLVLKYLPKEEMKRGNVDVIGLMLIGATAGTLLLYINQFNYVYLLAFIVAAGLFLIYISKSSKAFISISYFKNLRYVALLVLVFIIYSVQLGYIFVFPFLVEKLYALKLDKISLLLVPASVFGAIVGALSGKIARWFGTKQCITIALVGVVFSLLLGGIFIQTSVILTTISMTIFSGSFAFMYAPLVDSCMSSFEKEKSGAAYGFYGLILTVGTTIGIAYTAALMQQSSMHGIIINSTKPEVSLYSNILIILSLISVFCLILYRVTEGSFSKKRG
ncbi:MFS transporter [Paenibacillus sp. GCM10027628]|uniref:MFS transporter n=1 Tax=Paenibacillus sp. GCM10027628 TaxID=3273413 RepID=UPI0036329DE7